jgi:ribosomal protein S12 methylthiotransferase
MPRATLRTTVLVGFPGETDGAFETLLDFLETVRFDRVGVFTYSPEEGTPAPAMAGAVPSDVAQARAQLVQETQDRLAWGRQQALVGTVQEVLVDGPSQDPAFPWEGRIAAQAPEIDGVVYVRDADVTPGRLVPIEIVEADGYDLVGVAALHS